jgi:hypothetical protein
MAAGLDAGMPRCGVLWFVDEFEFATNLCLQSGFNSAIGRVESEKNNQISGYGATGVQSVWF